MAIILDQREIVELTGRKRRDCQKSALNHMGIEYRVRPDGSVAVSRNHVENVLGCTEVKKRKEVEPDWDAIMQPER